MRVELRQSRAAKDRTPWSRDAPPDVTMIPALPEDHQAIEEWMASRNRDLRDALEFRSADVISFVSNPLAQGAANLAARRASALALQSMEVQTSLRRMGAFSEVRGPVTVYGASEWVRLSILVQQRGLSAVVPDCRQRKSAPLQWIHQAFWMFWSSI